jgi:prevent-host-death family protein
MSQAASSTAPMNRQIFVPLKDLGPVALAKSEELVMETVNIHDAKTNLSRLIERTVSRGEAFIITRAGKPLVKVVPLDQAEKPNRRIGFMKGRISVPANFDDLHRDEITALFEGE